MDRSSQYERFVPVPGCSEPNERDGSRLADRLAQASSGGDRLLGISPFTSIRFERWQWPAAFARPVIRHQPRADSSPSPTTTRSQAS